MWLVLFRIFVLGVLAHAGWVYTPFPGRPAVGLALGVLLGACLITVEMGARRVPGHYMVGALVGGVTGLIGARLLWGALDAWTSWPVNSCTRCS